MTSTTQLAPPDLAGFMADRLGMFIHFGLYALAGRHEWVQNRERITPEEYRRYFDHFDPDLFDAADWARRCRRAGMRYAVLTTKHHEGFCLWDSEFTDYKITNTPFGRNLVAEFVDAFRAEGIKIGFYHSLLDWHHPDFTIDGHHPLRDDPNAAELNAGRDLARYRTYLHDQVRELLTGYGEISYLFYDSSSRPSSSRRYLGAQGHRPWAGADLMALARELQPGIVINDRLGIPGDLVTPEQYQPSEPMRRDGQPVAWEACQTINGSWGYFQDNTLLKTPELLVRMLVDGVSKGGNLFLNVAHRTRTDRPSLGRHLGPARRMDGPARPVGDRGRTERVHGAAGLSLHPARQPALSASVRLAVRTHHPARAGRQGRIRPAVERRIRDRHEHDRSGRAGPQHQHGWPTAADPHADPAGATAPGSRAGGRAVPAMSPVSSVSMDIPADLGRAGLGCGRPRQPVSHGLRRGRAGDRRRRLEGGIHFDTAPHYGLGLSERRLGAALAGHPRGGLLSTKVGRLFDPTPERSIVWTTRVSSCPPPPPVSMRLPAGSGGRYWRAWNGWTRQRHRLPARSPTTDLAIGWRCGDVEHLAHRSVKAVHRP